VRVASQAVVWLASSRCETQSECSHVIFHSLDEALESQSKRPKDGFRQYAVLVLRRFWIAASLPSAI